MKCKLLLCIVAVGADIKKTGDAHRAVDKGPVIQEEMIRNWEDYRNSMDKDELASIMEEMKNLGKNGTRESVQSNLAEMEDFTTLSEAGKEAVLSFVVESMWKSISGTGKEQEK